MPGFWGHVIQAISKKLVDQYQPNGVVCLRGVFADWIPALCKGADVNVESASNRVLIHGDGKTGRFLEDFCNWQRIPEYRDFVRGVLNRYLGYWDANPATLIPLSPSDSAPLYVEMMGCSEAIIQKGQSLFDEGKYRHAQEIVTKLIYANPQDQQAKYLLADIFEQIAYQQESPSVRNSFLAAALELRHGIPEGTPPKSFGPDLVKAMTTDKFLDFLGIRLDARKAEGVAFKINFVTPDNGEKYINELSNGALTNIAGYGAEDADLTITADRSDLDFFIMGLTSFTELAEKGKVKLEGNPAVFVQLQSMLVNFDGKFAIMPGTR